MQIDGFKEDAVLSQAQAAEFASVGLYVQDLLERDAERLATQEGIDDAKAGRIRDFDDFDREFRTRNGIRDQPAADASNCLFD